MIELIIKLIICIAFAILAIRFRVLDVGGTVSAVIIGAIILFSQGIKWFSLLLLFLILGVIATKYKENIKRKRLRERASRKAGNVIANGLIPALLAALSIKHTFSFLFVTAIAVALADTFASELGVLSDNAYLITNFKKVEPGTNGAISLLGEFVAFVGALIISFFGFFLLNLTTYEAILCIFLGLFGCHIDSLLGATFQGKYKGNIRGEDTILTNNDVNLISIAITTLMAFIIIEAI